MQKKILVVDDDPVFSELISDMLSEYAIVAARNGSEALHMLETERVDLVLSDIEMPIMDGMELHRRAHEYESLNNIPFIFVTGSEEENVIRYFQDRPTLLCIRKENLADQLLPAIARTIKHTAE